MMEPPLLTILHLSDLQFGKNHLFGRLHVPPPDAALNSLAVRLTDDLALLSENHGLNPNLIVVSGDIAEWALPAEFDQARGFLEHVTKSLNLPPSRVVLVPGNHDVNRRRCSSYFDERASVGEDPVPPFWPKWENFAAFFQKFYGDKPTVDFPVATPWTLFEFPELKLVVAGLNSTLAEIHDIAAKDPDHERYIKSGDFGHFGRVTETQCRWFAERLRRFRERGWFRLGVLHHNVRRGAVNDDEHLKDVDDLNRWLGSELNLLLHGHTHDGKQDLLPNGLLVLSTGSTALAKEARPEEVPCQYQVLRIGRDHIQRFTRKYDVGQKRWIADTRCSDNGDQWQIEHPVTFIAVDATFPPSTPPEPTESDKPPLPGSGRGHRDDPEGLRDELRATAGGRGDGFLERVADVCRQRMPNAKIMPQTSPTAPLAYLWVTQRDEFGTLQYPVGVCEQGVTQADIDRFLRDVDAVYRVADPRMVSELVYGGQQAAPELVEYAKNGGVRLQSFVEYRGLIDFGNYLKRQSARLAADPRYPRRLYVPQRMRYGLGLDSMTAPDGLDGPYPVFLPDRDSTDALGAVARWLIDSDGRFVLVLGDFGTGKTFLLRQLAHRLTETPGARSRC